MNPASERFAAVWAHRRFVAGVKATVRKIYGSVPDPATVLPTIVGAEPLGFKVPPIMEQAFGYRGSLRFVEFSYTQRTHQFGYSDGGDHMASDAQLWTEFVNHPLVCAEIGEDECLELYGDFRDRGGRFCRQFHRPNPEWHCLLLDRQERQPYLCTMKQVILFFPLTEPANGDDHTVFRDGLLLSPSQTEFRELPRDEVLRQIYAWLDDALLKTPLPDGVLI
jgi:hypothetical protein